MEEKDTGRDFLDKIEAFAAEPEARGAEAATLSADEERDARLLFGVREAFAVRSPHVRPDAKRAWEEFREKREMKSATRRRRGSLFTLHSSLFTPAKPDHSSLRRSWIAVAATLLLLIGWQWRAGWTWIAGETRLTAATAQGETREVRLADGTRVWLSASSSLTYPEHFKGESREVELRGEGYFKVSHDREHPFVVHTTALTTRVLGTEFWVSAPPRKAAAHVTLVGGSVSVSPAEGADGVVIRPGEDARLRGDGTLAVSRVDTDRYTMWRDGYFFFDNESVGDIATRLGEWYGVPVALHAPKSATNRRVHLVARRDSSAAEVLRLLSVVGGVRATMQGGKIMINGK